jgi:PhnB protein
MSHRRPDYNAIIPYLVVAGAAECIAFCQKIAGMQLIEREDNEDGSIMHSVLRLDDGIIEVSDEREGMPICTGMLHVYVDDLDARYEAAIAAGASSIMPPTDMPYGERTCGFTDPWGVQWWLASYTGSSEQA